MIAIVLLIFFGASAILLWAGHRAVPAGMPTGRVTAAFAGIWLATLTGVFMLLLGGLAETRPSGLIGIVALPVAVAETFWILVTCGLNRAARAPYACALLSLALLVWMAVT
ncbi:MAG TPA: hypothetical protein VFJ93_01075 [Gaiellaceae bacterium]|nr:hypothetical protein [Gaiellaceae bacterium]